ncbi:hypothetical protein CFter6_2065 [Collimonas fungivorans]|uniref:Uncharacterized protein n=1 Tax=Collimonas fungivorans TaxID=158899 RepID=A0A127PAC1_9BURK|nr:hypothetical protein CFter6_2065 [Collimonas fungivorans]
MLLKYQTVVQSAIANHSILRKPRQARLQEIPSEPPPHRRGTGTFVAQ